MQLHSICVMVIFYWLIDPNRVFKLVDIRYMFIYLWVLAKVKYILCGLAHYTGIHNHKGIDTSFAIAKFGSLNSEREIFCFLPIREELGSNGRSIPKVVIWKKI